MLIDIRSQRDRDLVSFSAYKNPVVGLTSGCFDLFHNLHLAYLRKCKRMCDVLVVGVDADDFVRKVKGPGRPVIPEHQRAEIVSALECVDVTFIMGSLDDWERACGTFHPSKLFKNTNFRPEAVVNPFGVEVVIVPDVMQFGSTSAIIQSLRNEQSTKAKPPGHLVKDDGFGDPYEEE